MIIICKCGNKFKTKPSKLKIGKGKYCSKQCLYKYRKPGGFKTGHKYFGLPKCKIKMIYCLCGCKSIIPEKRSNGSKRRYVKGHQGRGKLHYGWRNGITSLVTKIRLSKKCQEWRYNIYKRDGFKCVLCGDNTGGNLNVDHYPVSFVNILVDYKITTLKYALRCKKLWDENNGRTLCVPCHEKTDNYGKRYRK